MVIKVSLCNVRFFAGWLHCVLWATGSQNKLYREFKKRDNSKCKETGKKKKGDQMHMPIIQYRIPATGSRQ